MAGVVLEVAVGDPRDVPGAQEGGADRLHVAIGRRIETVDRGSARQRRLVVGSLDVVE